MDELVSVIIPVYNVIKYLEECVQSVIAQSYRNLEILLIDDGSTDGSGELCDRLKNEDDRICVIHKENGGLSDARNAGLDACHGSYVSFIDSDDYVSPYFIQVLLEAAATNRCKIAALAGGEDFWDEEMTRPQLAQVITEGVTEVCDVRTALERMLYQNIATGAPFKIYEKSIFQNIRFPVGWYYEDVATTYRLFLKVAQIAIVQGPFYAYRKRRDSIIRQSFSEKKLSALPIYDQLVADSALTELGLHEAAVSRAFSVVYNVFLQIPIQNKKTMRAAWEKLVHGRRTVLFNHSKLMRKKNRIGAIVSYLGMPIAYYLGRTFGQKGSIK